MSKSDSLFPNTIELQKLRDENAALRQKLALYQAVVDAGRDEDMEIICGMFIALRGHEIKVLPEWSKAAYNLLNALGKVTEAEIAAKKGDS